MKTPPQTMRAALLREPGQMEIVEAPVPSPAANQLLIEVEGCGVCASNLSPWGGQPWFEYPFAPGQLGHEAWGCVAARGADAEGFAIGERVAFLSNHAYAQYDVADVSATIKLPIQLDNQPFPGEPLACALNVWARCGVKSGDTVAIIGIGFLGALLIQLAKRAGARVLALSRRQTALDCAAKLGADETIALDDHWQIIERVKQLTNERFCDVTIEATGHAWPLDLAAELTRERGRLVIAGYHQDGPRQINMQLWNWRGLDVINAHERDPQIYLDGLTRAAQAVVAGELNPRELLTHRYGLQDLGAALNATRDRPQGFLKAWIEMDFSGA